MNEFQKLKKLNIHNINVKNIVDIRIISVVAVLSTLLSLWHSEVLYEQTVKQTVVHQTTKPHYSKLEFAISVLNLLQKNEPNVNIFYSPHSVHQALLLTYFAAAGKTKKDLEKVLGLMDWVDSKAEVEYRYKFENDLRIEQSQNESVEFISVNKLYVSNRISIRDSTKKALDDRIEQLNFADDPENSIKHINKFVEEITKNNIKDALQVSGKTASTQFAIVNAAYFNGQWVSTFDKGRSGKFYRNGIESVDVEMMNQVGQFKYGFITNLETQFLRMPYKGENERFSMYVLLPANTSTAIDELLGKLTAPILNDVFNGVYLKSTIFVSLPKFSIDKTSDLESVLKQMGVQNLFDKNGNFCDLYEGGALHSHDECLLETEMKHMAKIEINESGSKISAITSVMAGKLSMPFHFYCNRPFVFIVHDEKFEEVLFAGVYRGPN